MVGDSRGKKTWKALLAGENVGSIKEVIPLNCRRVLDQNVTTTATSACSGEWRRIQCMCRDSDVMKIGAVMMPMMTQVVLAK